ncbi:MAG: hypothetical protein CSYNP_03137 [Syntrophus sp. SKADARSKE-3]|nr:hypothetical protein [Syntrophus sp. SKADARSKE-3]
MHYQSFKFSTAKKQTYNGIRYDSGFEAKQAQELELRKRAGDIKNFSAHKKIELLCNGYRVGNYFVDFEVEHNDGTIEYIETKGRKTEVWALKWKIFETMFMDDPNVKLSLVMQKSFKLHKPKKLS